MKVIIYKNFVDKDGNTIEIDGIDGSETIIEINKTHYVSDIVIVMDK